MSIHVPPPSEKSKANYRRAEAIDILWSRTPHHLRCIDQGFDALVVVEADGPEVVRLFDLTNRQIAALMPEIA